MPITHSTGISAQLQPPSITASAAAAALSSHPTMARSKPCLFIHKALSALKLARTKGRASICGSTMVVATAKAPTPVSSRRAKIGVAARCGHSTRAVRPMRMTVAMPARAGTRRGHHSQTPKISHPARISQCSSGGICGAATPLRSGTRLSRRCMCQAEPSVSSSIGAVVGRQASAPKISTPMNRYGAVRDSFCRKGERLVSSGRTSTRMSLRSSAGTPRSCSRVARLTVRLAGLPSLLGA